MYTIVILILFNSLIRTFILGRKFVFQCVLCIQQLKKTFRNKSSRSFILHLVNGLVLNPPETDFYISIKQRLLNVFVEPAPLQLRITRMLLFGSSDT